MIYAETNRTNVTTYYAIPDEHLEEIKTLLANNEFGEIWEILGEGNMLSEESEIMELIGAEIVE
ncbi:MAG: hypothetical protein PHR28_12105 [candidate division Zixibacteria bacterium]|jgi:hypothetical protein|nr:hypothetical protein [candidate division Zixibacteria bacterium]